VGLDEGKEERREDRQALLEGASKIKVKEVPSVIHSSSFICLSSTRALGPVGGIWTVRGARQTYGLFS
jgi:hypothetical protein